MCSRLFSEFHSEISQYHKHACKCLLVMWGTLCPVCAAPVYRPAVSAWVVEGKAGVNWLLKEVKQEGIDEDPDVESW